MIYYILFIIFGAIAFLDILKISKKIKNYLFNFIVLLLLIFGSLRFEVGRDWENYKLLFLGEKIDVEYSYILLSKLFQGLNLGYSSFVFVIFILSFLLKCNVLKKYSKYSILSILIYFPTYLILYDMNGIRQGLALGITFYSFNYILKKEKNKFILLLIGATFIHTSAIIFLPAYFIDKLRIGNKLNIGIVFIMILNIYLDFILKIIVFLYSIFPYRFFQRLYDYSTIAKEENNIIGLLQRLIVFLLSFYFLRKIKKYNKKVELYIKLYTVSFYLYLLFYNFGLVASRGSAYYKIFELLLIPLFLDILGKKKILKIGGYILILLYTLLILYKYLNLPNNGGLLPYKNIILKKII